MDRFKEGNKIIEECCGHEKDNVIAISTIAIEKNENGNTYPKVRDVDAYYEDGIFYVVTSANSNKMKEIAKNNEVGFAICFEGISGNGIGKNLGWVLEPRNKEIRNKLRNTFSDWYDDANNEHDTNCVILAIQIKTAIIFRDHGATYFNLDFKNNVEIKRD